MTPHPLVAFLTARLAEDEADLKAKSQAAWERQYGEDGWDAHDYWEREQDNHDRWERTPHTAHCGYRQGEFNEDCDCSWPARALAEVAAKRAIIQAWILRDQQGSGPGEGAATIASHAVGVLVALRHLAAVHADHPDYRQEWTP